MEYLWVTLLGRPGSGKTTAGRALACSDGFGLGTVRYVSGSQLLDDYVAARRDDWRRVKREKDAGKTADPELTHELLEETIDSMQGGGVVLLDGFPKALAEVSRTEDAIPGGAIDLAVLLECPANECIERIEGRLVCGSCGAVTTTTLGARVSSACPKTGCDGSLDKRADDDRKERVHTQGEESASVLATHFRNLDRLVEVNAFAPRREVLAAVAEEVRNHTPASSPQNPD